MREEERALERLLDMASHQLKNPLQAIVVNAEVVRIRVGQELPELWSTLERHAAAIEENVRLLDRRLKLLVQVARAEAEQESSVQPARLCADLVGTAHFDVGPVPVRVEVGEAEPIVRARTGRLVELLLVLLERVRKVEGGEIRVWAEAADGGGAWLELSKSNGAAPPPPRGDAWKRIEALARRAGVEEVRVSSGGRRLRLRLPPA